MRKSDPKDRETNHLFPDGCQNRSVFPTDGQKTTTSQEYCSLSNEKSDNQELQETGTKSYSEALERNKTPFLLQCLEDFQEICSSELPFC
jgi:hypothetical protein